jgi:hypothetical protein
MGKMKEVFIKDIEDFGEHREHIDDDYHYRKHLQKKAMKQFNKTLKMLPLVASMLLTTISYGQFYGDYDYPCFCLSNNGEYSFTVVYDGLNINGFDLVEGYEIEWDDWSIPQDGVITQNVYWNVTRGNDEYYYNDLSEFDNKPYVQVEADGWGYYNFYMHNSETDEVIRETSLYLDKP